jgi:hypothetical protein
MDDVDEDFGLDLEIEEDMDAERDAPAEEEQMVNKCFGVFSLKIGSRGGVLNLFRSCYERNFF